MTNIKKHFQQVINMFARRFLNSFLIVSKLSSKSNGSSLLTSTTTTKLISSSTTKSSFLKSFQTTKRFSTSETTKSNDSELLTLSSLNPPLILTPAQQRLLDNVVSKDPPIVSAKTSFFVPNPQEFKRIARPIIPAPRYGMTVELFLEKIGKGCKAHAEKFPTWEELMAMTSREMKAKGIPTADRKWIRHWIGKYRVGIEPFSIRFKSKARKNKLQKKEAQAKHKQQKEDGAAKRKEYFQQQQELRKQLFGKVVTIKK